MTLIHVCTFRTLVTVTYYVTERFHTKKEQEFYSTGG